MNLCALRRELRSRRKAIIGAERAQKSQAAAENALAAIAALQAANIAVKNIGVFLSLAEEIDTAYLIEQLWARDYRLFLPVVQAREAPLVWRAYQPDSRLCQDVFGLTVPEPAEAASAAPLDVVIMPLVGFDKGGNRIGMGGGFYDRSFADKIAAEPPYLLGLAYECQAVEEIARQAWDIPMNALATEAQLVHFN